MVPKGCHSPCFSESWLQLVKGMVAACARHRLSPWALSAEHRRTSVSRLHQLNQAGQPYFHGLGVSFPFATTEAPGKPGVDSPRCLSEKHDKLIKGKLFSGGASQAPTFI